MKSSEKYICTLIYTICVIICNVAPLNIILRIDFDILFCKQNFDVSSYKMI